MSDILVVIPHRQLCDSFASYLIDCAGAKTVIASDSYENAYHVLESAHFVKVAFLGAGFCDKGRRAMDFVEFAQKHENGKKRFYPFMLVPVNAALWKACHPETFGVMPVLEYGEEQKIVDVIKAFLGSKRLTSRHTRRDNILSLH